MLALQASGMRNSLTLLTGGTGFSSSSGKALSLPAVSAQSAPSALALPVAWVDNDPSVWACLDLVHQPDRLAE